MRSRFIRSRSMKNRFIRSRFTNSRLIPADRMSANPGKAVLADREYCGIKGMKTGYGNCPH